MEALHRPGPEHRRLGRLVGQWSVRATFHDDRDAVPRILEGTAINSMAIGGRFLVSDYLWDQDGSPVEGFGLLGYDNARERFVATWVDSTQTGITPLSHGHASLGGDRITLTRLVEDPFSGALVTITDVYLIEDEDRYRIETYTTGPDGREFRVLEAVHTRL
jgi:hypothetical protein